MPRLRIKHKYVLDSRRHDTLRESGWINYLKSQSKRQKLYDDYQNRMADSYSQGDLVGISIDKVDRTNCDAKLMPCIIDERVNQGATPTFRLICPFGRLSSLFPLHHLFRITSPVPDSLVNVHGTNIPTVSFVQACKMYARRGKCTNAD